MKTKVSILRIVMVLITTWSMFFAIPFVSAAPSPSASLWQWANKDSQWVKGNLGASKAEYHEGDSIPYRLLFGNLNTGATSPHTVTIEWDTTKSSKHAIDYLSSFDESENYPSPDPRLGTSNTSSPSTFGIPLDTQITGFGPIPGVFTIYGGNITGVSSYDYVDGTGFSGDKTARITITFTADIENPILAWGGHISTRLDWGETESCISISGSPYHTRLIDIDGSGGNQDRSLSSEAVIFPGSITIIKDAIPNGSTKFDFTASPSPLENFQLFDDGDPDHYTKIFSGITNFTTYAINETVPSNWALVVSDPVYQFQNGGTAGKSATGVTINLKEGEDVTCTFTNTRQQGSIEVKKFWSGTAGSTTLQIGTTAGDDDIYSKTISGENGTTGNRTVVTGTYYVSEDMTSLGDYDTLLVCTKNGNPYTPGANGSIVVGNGDVFVCTFTNTRQQGSIEVKKVWSGTAGSTTLQIGTTAGEDDICSYNVDGINDTTGAQTVDTGTYYISEDKTDLDEYDSVLTCTKNGEAYTPGTNGSIEVGDGDVVVCTFTNTRKAADLELIKTGTISYSIYVTNNGPSTAYNVEISDDLNNDLVWEIDDILTSAGITIDENDFSIEDNQLYGTIDELPMGGWIEIILIAEIDSDSEEPILANSATASSSTYDPDGDNNTDSANIGP